MDSLLWVDRWTALVGVFARVTSEIGTLLRGFK